ncbi:MAG: DUF3298 and DUF4163 domain-containing protein [Pseudodesulfovibrio sp.]
MRCSALLFFILSILWCPVLATAHTKVCTPAVLSSITIAEETAGYSIDIVYPVLCSPKANRIIRDHVTHSLSAFKMEFPEHDLTEYRHKHQMMTDAAVWTAAQGRLASVKLQVMVFTGGAHPNNWPETWVFDMTDGHVLNLGDIFTNERDALSAIEPMVREVLMASLGEMYNSDMLNGGIKPTASNYEDFILNDEGVAFFFAPYQVAPYAAGQQVVTIPYERLTEFLTPKIAARVQ